MIIIKYLTKLHMIYLSAHMLAVRKCASADEHALCLNSPWVQQLHHDQMLPHYQGIPK